MIVGTFSFHNANTKLKQNHKPEYFIYLSKEISSAVNNTCNKVQISEAWLSDWV